VYHSSRSIIGAVALQSRLDDLTAMLGISSFESKEVSSVSSFDSDLSIKTKLALLVSFLFSLD
jgi:hypothetical protein